MSAKLYIAFVIVFLIGTLWGALCQQAALDHLHMVCRPADADELVKGKP